MADCLARGEAPYASHGLYTQPGVLDDNIQEQRDLGIAAGFAWRKVAELTAVYTDRGVSTGMKFGIEDAQRRNCPVEHRQVPGWPFEEPPVSEPDRRLIDALVKGTSIGAK
jgi:hypothetical protein